MKFDPALEDALSEPTEAEAQAAAMRDALEAVQDDVSFITAPYSGHVEVRTASEGSFCPACRMRAMAGHAPDCRLAKLLGT